MKVHGALDDPTGIEAEIVKEKLATLVRIAKTLQAHVEELERARRAVAEAAPGERPARVARFEEQRDVARTWHWYLLVQREAVGLRRHEGLAEHYPIPDLP